MNNKIRKKGIGKRFAALLTSISLTAGLAPAFSLSVFADGDFSGGTGTVSNPYLIASAEDLKDLADKVNAGEESYASAYYKIQTERYTYTDKDGTVHLDEGVQNLSIDLSAYSPWTPIGTEAHPFKGHFNGSSNENKGDGRYGKIHNVTLALSEGAYTGSVQTAGIFGYTDGATIANLYTSDITVGDVKLNTYNTNAGAAKSYHCIGGVVGFAKDSKIQFCTTYSPITVTAKMGEDGGKIPELYVGGAIGGESGSEIFRCINNSALTVNIYEESFTTGRIPDIFTAGVVGGVNGISSEYGKIHGCENINKVTVNVPVITSVPNMKIFTSGIVGGVSDISAGKLEISQCFNKSSISAATAGLEDIDAEGGILCIAGVLGYDDVDKLIHVHDCKNEGAVDNKVKIYNDSVTAYAAGIVAGRGNVDNCMNTGAINSNYNASGICYSVPHNCYATAAVGPIVPGNNPICSETPSDTAKDYYNYFTVSDYQSRDSNWQHYVSDSKFINNGALTWLLQGGQDSNYLHWTATSGAPLLAGGYYVQSGGRPLDYWLNKGWGAYNNDMGREIVSFAPAWSYRILKYRYVTTGEGNDGVDPVTGEDLKADNSFESYAKSDTSQFYAVGYGYYCGRIGALPTVESSDKKTFIQWQTTPAEEGKSANLDASFANSGANSTVYAVARVKFGAKDDDNVYRSVYGDGNEINALSDDVEYGAEPDTTEGKFTYTLTDAATEDNAIEDAAQYFSIDGETLKVAKSTPAGIYSVSITAKEKQPSYTLFSLGFDDASITLKIEVVKKDPSYTPPQTKQRVYDGEAADVITAGSTSDGKILYTLTPTDDASWSESVPQASELGLYTVYWKIEGDSNHNDKSPDVVSGLIYPDSSDPANAIIVTPTANWTYDQNTYPLATVTKPDFADIEWSSNNTDWTDTLPTATNAGSYPVYWRVKKNDLNIDDSGSFTVTVSKATLAVTPPTGLTRKYTGSEQELVTAGSLSPEGKGTMKYSLNPALNNWADSNWSEAIPTRTYAGEYKVYYRVFPNDLNNYVDTFDQTNPTYVNAEITKLKKEDFGDNLKVTKTADWTYDGSTKKLVDENNTKLPAGTGLRLMYLLDGDSKWDYTIPTGSDAGDYKVKWKTVGNDNVEEITGEFTVKVSKKNPVVEFTPEADWTYDGKTHTLVTVTKNEDNLRFNYSLNGGTALSVPPTGSAAGTYKVSVTSVQNDNYETYQGSFEIKCFPAEASGSVTGNTLIFNYGEQELVTPNDDVTNGKLMYKVEGESAYSNTIPRRSDAGTYKVWYYVKGNDTNYADTDPADVDVTIAKLSPTPIVNESSGLRYNKSEQTLLTVDTEGHYGTVKYSVKTDGSEPSDSDWTTDVPKAENAGDYKVYWKVFDDSGRNDGDTNLVEPSGSRTVSIAKYDASIAYIHAEDKPYNGQAQQLVEPIKARNDMGTVKYVVKAAGETPSDEEWTTEVPSRTESGSYFVWFKVDGDDNIEAVKPDKIEVKITKVVPRVSVTIKGALKYNGSNQDLIANTTVEAGAGGGQLKFAVTTDASATEQSLEWSTAHPEQKENNTYYVWYKFDGDSNTESIAAKKSISVINGNIPDLTVKGEHLDYNDAAQELIEGTIDNKDIKSNTNIKYYISYNPDDTYTAAQTDSWSTAFPTGKDAKKYYVWYYVPENGSNIAVGPAVVEAEIRKAGPPDYDFENEKQTNSDKLGADGMSFTVEWNTKIKSIALHQSDYGTYEWFHFDDDFTLTTIGTYNYPAYFKANENSNYESGIVQIRITVTPIKEDKPNIGIDYVAEKLTGFDPSKTYSIWSGEHTDSTMLDIPDERMNGENTSIILKASTNHTIDSEAQELLIPTRPPAPKTTDDGGEIEVHQPAFITGQGRLDGIGPDMEYSVDGGAWIDGNNTEFSVAKNTKVNVRYKAVANTSFKSFPLEIEIGESQREKVTIDQAPGINYPNHAIKDLEPNTKYTISYTDDEGQVHKFRVETDDKGEVPIEEEWHEQTVDIVKNGDILYTVDSDPEKLYISQRPDAPKPDSADSRITKVVRTDEYRLVTDTNYTTVQNDDRTNVVEPDKYVVRVKATDTSFASLDSYVVVVRELTPDARIDYEKETLNNLLPSTEYIITEPDGNVISVVTDSNGEIPIKDNWFGTRENGEGIDKTLLISKKGKTDAENSPDQKRLIPPRPDKPSPSSRDSKITDVAKTMEYRLAANAGAYKVVENSEETNPVTPDDYEVRVKAVVDVSFASLPASITVNPMSVPEGQIDYENIKLKNLVPGEDYTIIDENGNEKTITADSEGKIPIKEDWLGTDIKLIRNGENAIEDSDPQTLNIPTRPNPPEPRSADSKITNVAPTMEYRPSDSGDEAYITVENAEETNKVEPGDYVVRVKATPTSFPSLPAEVTVEPVAEPIQNQDKPKLGGGKKTTSTPSPAPAPTEAPEDNGSDNGNSESVPTLNKTDHFAYISGYEDNTFRPDRSITRAEAAAIFARLMTDFDGSKTYTPTFDLTEDMYFYSHVGFLEKHGIITGYEDGTFRPYNSITRAEFAVMAAKFAELTETEGNVFSDVADDFWGKKYILLAHKNGWVDGYEDGTYRPNQTITRAEVVSIVNRMLERFFDEEFASDNSGAIKTFNDITDSHWAYGDILEAANGHLYITQGSGEKWTDLI